MKEYDYLIVGSGLFGSTFANLARQKGRKVLVVEKRENIGGNVFTEEINKIHVHKYGPHIFHTNNDDVWKFVNQFASFNNFVNSPVANYKGELYPLPFNMNTFNRMWGVVSPEEARKKLSEQIKENYVENPSNLEEQALNLVGKDIYEKIIKNYTQKQWGRPCSELPPEIIKRIPVRFTYDNNYYDAKYQGIPQGGYTRLVENMLDGAEVIIGLDFHKEKESLRKVARKIVYTGQIDELYGYCFGWLAYRTVDFKTECLPVNSFQGNAVINYTDAETPFTRIIEHKWFEFGKDSTGRDIEGTVISKEYSSEWGLGKEPYYPIEDQKNKDLYARYRELAAQDGSVLIGGRLGEYRYLDMDKTIESAMELCRKEALL
ncbi:MAG: UDP-galactopyranose mutase [Oscillospiraceae bacterium]|nr:UDP-galactopyranose mutase [Oscillospiraceae bacterium]